MAPVGEPTEPAREALPQRRARDGQPRRTPERPHKPRKATAPAPRHPDRPRSDERARGGKEQRRPQAAGDAPPRRARDKQRPALFAPRQPGPR